MQKEFLAIVVEDVSSNTPYSCRCKMPYPNLPSMSRQEGVLFNLIVSSTKFIDKLVLSFCCISCWSFDLALCVICDI